MPGVRQASMNDFTAISTGDPRILEIFLCAVMAAACWQLKTRVLSPAGCLFSAPTPSVLLFFSSNTSLFCPQLVLNREQTSLMVCLSLLNATINMLTSLCEFEYFVWYLILFKSSTAAYIHISGRERGNKFLQTTFAFKVESV